MAEQVSHQERIDGEADLNAEQSSQRAASEWQSEQLQQRIQNPEFFDRVTDPGVDSAKYDWLSDDLGALFASAHFIANRGEHYEREAKWLNQNRVERKLAMHNPGRLCKGPVRKIAQRVHGRKDKSERKPMLQDDRQALRLAGLAATNYHSLAVQNTGLEAVTEATTVHKREQREEASRAKRFTEKIL